MMADYHLESVSKRRGRNIGQRILDMCAMIEECGPSEIKLINARLGGVETSNAGKYCSRAVCLGLMTVERGMNGKCKYAIYSIVPGWREIANARRTTKPISIPRSMWHGVASIFQIGNCLAVQATPR